MMMRGSDGVQSMWYTLGQIRGSTGKTLGEGQLEAVEFEISTKLSDYL